jgi:hypothetical protein
MRSYVRYKVTAQDATTVTLQPDAGESSKGDYADKITQIVLTFTARDTVEFDATNRRFIVAIERVG